MGKVQLTSTNFFLLQLLVAPAFLGPLYYNLPGRGRPYLQLFTLLLAPVSYVAVFACRSLSRSIAQRPRVPRSIVFAAIRSGILFGLVFGLLVVASLGVLWGRDQWNAGLTLGRAVWNWPAGALAGAFLLLHYLLIGAATGGLVGMAVDVGSGCRRALHLGNRSLFP